MNDCNNCKHRGVLDICKGCIGSLDPTTVPSMWEGKEPDMVNNPPHYEAPNGMKAIDVIEAFTVGLTGYEAVYTAKIIKYALRWKHKDGIRDLKKIQWYVTRLINNLEKEK